MLWLTAYLAGFPPVGLHSLCWTHGLTQAFSYCWLCNHRYPCQKCVNALNGLTSISTADDCANVSLPYACVNALNGLTSISTQCGHLISELQLRRVNALNGLTSISTNIILAPWRWPFCVNALNGLTSISTAASRNPWFYWLPRAIFTSN